MIRRKGNEDPRPGVRLVLRTLGTHEGSSESESGERLGRFGPGKPLSLLVYLAHSPNRAAPRDHLVDLLWGDVDTDAARHALRQTIWYVRRTLGEGVLDTDGDVVRLAAWCDSDAHDFIRAVDEHDEEKAMALYAGDFLPDIAIPGGAEFERWADLERLRLRAIFTRTAESRVLHYLSRGEGRLALPIARRARDADPGDERLWRRLLEVHLALRDVVGASAEADAFEHLWQTEERELEAASRTLLRRARNQSGTDGPAATEAGAIVAALVGRATEFTALTAAWDDVQRSGRQRHLHISAPAGLGKTRLLTDLRSRLRASRSRVVLVRANPGERTLAYALVAGLAQSLAELPGAAAIAPDAANVLVQLNPALSSHFPEAKIGQVESEPLRRRTVALRELCSAVADERPVALLVDDLHWADRESLAVLAACAGNLGEGRLLLVTSARGAASQWFADAPVELALKPLDGRALAELVASLGQLPDAPWADQLPTLLLRASGGSPLLALEMLQLAAERGLLTLVEGHWHCPDPARLESLLAETNPLAKRIGQVDAESRQVLILLAAAGVPCGTPILATAAQSTTDALAALLQGLEVRGLVQRAGEQWLPAHDEIAAAIFDSMDGLTLKRARLAIAHAVVADPATDLGALRLAADLLVASGESGELAELFARFARLREASGVRGTAEEHLRALIAVTLPPDRRGRVLRAAPWRTRVGRRVAVAAFAVLAGLVGVAGIVGWRHVHSADVVLYLLGSSSDSSSLNTRMIGLRFGDRLPASIEMSRLHSGKPMAILADAARSAVTAPDGTGWYTQRTYPDSGGDELVVVDRAGRLRRLTNSVGDDGSPRVSPDNRYLYFATSRYDPQMHPDIARLDLKTGVVRPLTTGPDAEGSAMPSPDGSALAYVVRGFDADVQYVCIVDADGTHRRCRRDGTEVVGWRDERHVWVFSTVSHDTLSLLDTETLTEQPVCSGVSHARLSPDGHWMLVSGLWAGYDGVVLWLAETATPCGGALLLVHGRPLRQAEPAWDVQTPMPNYVDRIRIVKPDDARSFAPVQLFAEGRTPSGVARGIGAIRWRSLDTLVAGVTDQGLMIPRAAGTARLVVSAGGWRADTAVVRVQVEAPQLIERTTWNAPRAGDAWWIFGTPSPFIDSSLGRPLLSLNGDSTYPNGIRLRRQVDAGTGVTLRARVRQRISASQWQTLSLRVGTAAPDSSWARWDRRTGPPPTPPTAFAHCDIAYPSREGKASWRSMAMGESHGFHEFPAPSVVGRGEWAWEEVQLLPDGRCGIAVDDRPLLLSSGRQPMTNALELLISGQSHRTVTLIDTVEIYRGVLHPQWWAALDLRRSVERYGADLAGNRGAMRTAGVAPGRGRRAPAEVAPSGEEVHQLPPR